MSSRKAATAAVVALLAVAVLLANELARSEARKVAPTSYAKNGLGLSVFFRWLKQEAPDQVAPLEAALLHKEQLEGRKGYVLFSPGQPVSDLKQELLDQFVRGGGTLLLSAHNEHTLEMLRPLLARFQLKPELVEDDSFRNGEPVLATTEHAIGHFLPRETYAFYSPWRFKGCRIFTVECYVVQASHFGGQIYLFLGLPPVANGLLLKQHNHRFARRVSGSLLPLTVDEFDHFFSNRELLDLLATPTFALPAGGMLLAYLLFMLFAEHPIRVEAPAKARRARSFHQAGHGVLEAAIASESGRHRALRYLAAALARRTRRPAPKAPSSDADFLSNASALVSQYRAWLESKRKARR